MDNFPWHLWVGLLGTALVLLAYFLLQIRKLNGHGMTYQLMNALGSLGVLVSLVAIRINLVAVSLALAWLLISIYGIAFGFRGRRDARDAHRDKP
jgi:hypothetical protein